MYNSDVLEIRKRFKKEKTTIGRITGCYVTGADKQIKTYIDTDFVDLEEAEQFKYIEILKKGLSGVLNKNLFRSRKHHLAKALKFNNSAVLNKRQNFNHL